MSFGKKASVRKSQGALRPALKTAGANGTGGLPWGVVGVGVGAGLIVLLAVVLVVLPSLSGAANEADPTGGTWRAALSDTCPAPAVGTDPLPPPRKNASTSIAASRHYTKRTEDLIKLGQHIACAAQHNPARLCTPAARAEFLGHVRRYVSMRAELLERLATAAGKPLSESEKFLHTFVASDEAQITTRMNERDREQVNQTLKIAAGDPNFLDGVSGLVQDGFLLKSDLARTVGPKVVLLAPVMTLQPTRIYCRA